MPAPKEVLMPFVATETRVQLQVGVISEISTSRDAATSFVSVEIVVS
jgi:hypothetical protein